MYPQLYVCYVQPYTYAHAYICKQHMNLNYALYFLLYCLSYLNVLLKPFIVYSVEKAIFCCIRNIKMYPIESNALCISTHFILFF